VTSDTHTVLRVLQRVVFPGDDLDIVPLYVETNPERGAGELASELAMEAQTGGKATAVSVPVASAAVGEAQHIIRFGPDVTAKIAEDAGPRRSAVISAGSRVSFATYVNAFPASYWRRWTTVTSVTLRMRLAGECRVILYRSTAKGFSYPVETISVESGEPTTIQRTLPLTPFIDGGWYWFDIVSGPLGTTLIEADWLAATQPARPGRVSIGITAFNRPSEVLEQLHTLGDATDIHGLLDKVYVIDQGTEKVRDQPGFADAAKHLGDRLQVIEQGNLGGSGGFSRSMDETVRAGQSDYLLIMDDDVQFDAEGILRAATFADLARRPTIVGGHMFSLVDRSLLHAYAETVEPWAWWWGPAPNTEARHDFGRRNLRNTPWLHRRADSDYNGWWMCLIPVQVIAEIGLSLPVFIKWDDAEYGLRARDRGYPTVSLPGVASWQIPWDEKDDSRDWQAYFHLRNRLVSALLHSPHKAGGGVIGESRERQLQSLLSMYYSTAALQLLAVEDVLTGPEHLHRDLPAKIGQLRELRARYPDARYEADLESFPPPRRKAPDSLKYNTSPTTKLSLLTKAARGTLRQFRAPRPGAAQRPQMALPYQDASWWVLATLDSALVSSAENTTAAWLVRDRGQFRTLAWRSVILHRRLARRWSRLAAEYRAAATDFNSPERWRQTFAASIGEPADRERAEGEPTDRQFPENQ
jgi:galactofuranosylgalactofuranosylrhamnosyl-N-acetylglucosaminyl-diphospho-decaprenol beta-1,5/1,6-galactofuranosyltransferase